MRNRQGHPVPPREIEADVAVPDVGGDAVLVERSVPKVTTRSDRFAPTRTSVFRSAGSPVPSRCSSRRGSDSRFPVHPRAD